MIHSVFFPGIYPIVGRYPDQFVGVTEKEVGVNFSSPEVHNPSVKIYHPSKLLKLGVFV